MISVARSGIKGETAPSIRVRSGRALPRAPVTSSTVLCIRFQKIFSLTHVSSYPHLLMAADMMVEDRSTSQDLGAMAYKELQVDPLGIAVFVHAEMVMGTSSINSPIPSPSFCSAAVLIYGA